MITLLAISNALATGGVVFLAIALWKTLRELTSAKIDLVIERQARALAIAANATLRNAQERELKVATVELVPPITDVTSTQEIADNIRLSLRLLAGVPTAPKDDHDLPNGAVHEAAPEGSSGKSKKTPPLASQ